MAVRTRFEQELEDTKLSVIKMSGKVKLSIDNSIKALVHRNHSFARATIESDAEINQMERDIEKKCFNFILRQQPVASDFRQIAAAMRIIGDLERIGDQACDIASIVLKFKESEEYIKKLEHIPLMSELGINMVNNCVDAYINDDLELAKGTVIMDDQMDAEFVQLKRELISLVKKDAHTNAEQAMELLMIAKHLEKIGDHAVNICAWVLFSKTGKKRFFDPNPEPAAEKK
jgi:phosphate transport system protein